MANPLGIDEVISEKSPSKTFREIETLKTIKKSIMTRITSLMPILFAVAVLGGCSSNKSGQMAKVSPEKTTVSGPLGDFVEVVDNPYEISGE